MSSSAPAIEEIPRSIRSMLALAGALGTRDARLIRREMVKTTSRCNPVEVDELLIMSCFITGFPAGLAALELWCDLRPHGTQRTERSPQIATGSGENVCRAVYGTRFEALIDRLYEMHPDLPGLVLTYGYGAMMARPGMSLAMRELCLVAMLVPWGAEPQMYAHMRGALETGAAAREVEAAIEAGGAAARAAGTGGAAPGDDAETTARGTWATVVGRRAP